MIVSITKNDSDGNACAGLFTGLYEKKEDAARNIVRPLERRVEDQSSKKLGGHFLNGEEPFKED